MDVDRSIGFELPLSAEEWRRALGTGHGRVLLDARRFGGRRDNVPAILEAGVRNLVYDAQCEFSRAAWIIEIAEACGVSRELCIAVLEAIEKEDDDVCYWDAVQRREIALHFATKGDARARQVLYASFRKERHTLDLVGADELIALDGAAGLLHVARELGRLCSSDPDIFAIDQPIETFDESRGEGSARSLLEEAAASDDLIRTYLRCIDRENVDESEHATSGSADTGVVNIEAGAGSLRRRRIHEYSVEEVIAEIKQARTEDVGVRFQLWGSEADQKDLAMVLDELESERDPRRICKYLRVFFQASIPELRPFLIELASHEDPEVRYSIHHALAGFPSDDVRELALRKLRYRRILEGEIRLLAGNYRPGDSEEIERALLVPDEPEELHRLCLDLVTLSKAQTTLECVGSMNFVYEYSPCSLCRLESIKILQLTGALSEWIVEEGKLDGQENIRDFLASQGSG